MITPEQLTAIMETQISEWAVHDHDRDGACDVCSLAAVVSDCMPARGLITEHMRGFLGTMRMEFLELLCARFFRAGVAYSQAEALERLGVAADPVPPKPRKPRTPRTPRRPTK